jgi:hypothetical protein
MSGLVSKERLILDFHKLEGDFFHRLVHDLAQDQTSMRWVIAFWLWLESAGHHNFVRRAYALPGTAVLRLVEEAVACLGCLAGEGYDAGDTRIASLPCTNAFLAEPIDDLGYFVERRKEVLKGVNYMYKTVSLVVCLGNAANRAPAGAAGGARAAAPPKTSSPDDGAATLMMSSPEERASPLRMTTRARGAPQMTSSPDRATLRMMTTPSRGAPQMMRSPDRAAQLMVTTPGCAAPLMMNTPCRAAPLMMITPGRGAPLMMNTPCRAAAPMPSTLNPMASPWVPMMQEQSPLPEDYRSLFVTFSKGYPVSRDDIMEFFSW